MDPARPGDAGLAGSPARAAGRLRSFYFFYYGAVGANLPYFAPYLRGLGFTGEQIGSVLMLGPILSAPVALAWATAADRLGTPARALALASVGSVLATLFLPVARTPLSLAAVVVAQALADRAVVPLADSVTLEWTRTRRGPSYTRIRLFGSLGFIVFAQGVGVLLAARGDRPGDVVVPLVVLGCVAAYALAARRLPAVRSAPPRAHLRELLALARDRRLVTLLAACGLHWLACAPFHLMFGVFVRDARLPATITGLAMAVGVGAEVVAMLLFPQLSRRLSVRALLALSFAGSAVRWALVWRARSPEAIVLLQLFHGLTFGVFWGASMLAMTRIVPPALRATGQALFAAVVFGGGNALGFQLAGLGYDRLGGVAPLFAAAAALEAALAAAMLASGRSRAAPGGA